MPATTRARARRAPSVIRGFSNCGLDVETMDTTFKSTASRHNIHFVKCEDCHQSAVPPRRRGRRSVLENAPRTQPRVFVLGSHLIFVLLKKTD